MFDFAQIWNVGSLSPKSTRKDWNRLIMKSN